MKMYLFQVKGSISAASYVETSNNLPGVVPVCVLHVGTRKLQMMRALLEQGVLRDPEVVNN